MDTFTYSFLCFMVVVSVLILLKKWNSPLLSLILLEVVSASTLVFIFQSGFSFLMVSVVLVLSFFVSEALILLASLYSSARDWGTTQSTMLF